MGQPQHGPVYIDSHVTSPPNTSPPPDTQNMVLVEKVPKDQSLESQVPLSSPTFVPLKSTEENIFIVTSAQADVTTRASHPMAETVTQITPTNAYQTLNPGIQVQESLNPGSNPGIQESMTPGPIILLSRERPVFQERKGSKKDVMFVTPRSITVTPRSMTTTTKPLTIYSVSGSTIHSSTTGAGVPASGDIPKSWTAIISNYDPRKLVSKNRISAKTNNDQHVLSPAYVTPLPKKQPLQPQTTSEAIIGT